MNPTKRKAQIKHDLNMLGWRFSRNRWHWPQRVTRWRPWAPYDWATDWRNY